MRERNRWQEAPPAAEPAAETAPAEAAPPPLVGEKKIILFAPTDPGPLAAHWETAPLDLPHEMALRVDLLMRGFDGRVGETLPASFAARWDEGRVAATAGCHAVVLTRIDSLTLVKGGPGTTGNPDRIEVVAELRVLDVDGKPIYHKRAIGSAVASTSPKLNAAGAKPESRAAWDALDAGLADVRTFLSAQNELSSAPTPGTVIDPASIALIEVSFDTAPAGAEIHIDNAFRGHSPLKLKLPPRQMKVRVVLEGFDPWERDIEPKPGMIIQPVLKPVAAPPAEAAPAPAVEPAPAPEAADEPVG